jgi:hypothetical protein
LTIPLLQVLSNKKTGAQTFFTLIVSKVQELKVKVGSHAPCVSQTDDDEAIPHPSAAQLM